MDDTDASRTDIRTFMETARSVGLTVIFKVDGDRSDTDLGAYTFVASGPAMGEDFVRVDGRDFDRCLADGLAHLLSRGDGWGWVEGFVASLSDE